LARQYADLVESVAATGPVRLLGWSFGGAVALLMAQELTRRGRDVRFVGMLDAYPEITAEGAFDTPAVLAGLLREMGFPVDPAARMTVDDAVALMRSFDDDITILDDAQIVLAIQNYLAAERFIVGADYGTYDGDVFFVDAGLEVDRYGVSSDAWRPHVAGELSVVALQCKHSELLDTETLQQLGPLIAARL
jgi:thioesterase domain-containing protein